MKTIILAFIIYSTIQIAAASIGCLDANGRPVDWWIIFKVPTLHSGDAAAQSGFAYGYADVNSPSISYNGSRLDSNSNNPLANTLNQIYSNARSSSVAYVMYNDESPDNKNHEDYGHTKGDVCYDSQSGFWLVHSTPRWPNAADASYDYPLKEKIYGQSFMCMTYSTTYFDTVGAQFLLNKPYVYDSNLPSSLASMTPNMVALLNKNFVRGASNQTQDIQTRGGAKFTSFAKTGDWKKNLYEDFVEPYYNSGMMVETWMNGEARNKMPSFCRPDYPYNSINVRQVTLGNLNWLETDDHSKWAVSTDQKGYFCIGDINRQFSQSKRGGGTVCSYNPSIWKAMTSLITQHDNC